MSEYIESHSYRFVFDLLLARLEERAPAKIQLLAGPRQVGKTTLLGEIAVRWEGRAIYASADAPEAELPGWADGIWRRAVEKSSIGPAVLLLDEVHFLPEWSRWLKARHDEVVRKKIPLHTVATGSSALDLGDGSRETMAGRFEKLSLHHWGAGALVDLLGVKRAEAPLRVVTCGGYPGARPFWKGRRSDAISCSSSKCASPPCSGRSLRSRWRIPPKFCRWRKWQVPLPRRGRWIPSPIISIS
ncbi:MAG: hypothetical protein EBT03_09745 [Betaproteobacteria bacterium]|nr:hypothetical protein [Betaproteobacteria bacterium]